MTELTDAPCSLDGLSVLVTRPAEQAVALCEMIEQARGRPVRFPALEIAGPSDKQAVVSALRAASNADMLVFVSANAVRYAFPLLPDQIPFDIQIAAVGNATAEALARVGLDSTIVPAEMTSEGLLATDALRHVAGKRILLIRGNGGRELIADTLRQREARVEAIEVYRRRVPQHPSGVRNLLNGWPQLVQVVTATSIAVLDNLFTLLGEEGGPLLRETPLVVVSQRMADHALKLGCCSIHVAASACDRDVLLSLCEINQDVA